MRQPSPQRANRFLCVAIVSALVFFASRDCASNPRVGAGGAAFGVRRASPSTQWPARARATYKLAAHGGFRPRRPEVEGEPLCSCVAVVVFVGRVANKIGGRKRPRPSQQRDCRHRRRRRRRRRQGGFLCAPLQHRQRSLRQGVRLGADGQGAAHRARRGLLLVPRPSPPPRLNSGVRSACSLRSAHPSLASPAAWLGGEPSTQKPNTVPCRAVSPPLRPRSAPLSSGARHWHGGAERDHL